MLFISIITSIKKKLLLFTVNKQINDKERVAAAMENPSLRDVVEKCIKEEE